MHLRIAAIASSTSREQRGSLPCARHAQLGKDFLHRH